MRHTLPHLFGMERSLGLYTCSDSAFAKHVRVALMPAQQDALDSHIATGYRLALRFRHHTLCKVLRRDRFIQYMLEPSAATRTVKIARASRKFSVNLHDFALCTDTHARHVQHICAISRFMIAHNAQRLLRDASTAPPLGEATRYSPAVVLWRHTVRYFTCLCSCLGNLSPEEVRGISSAEVTQLARELATWYVLSEAPRSAAARELTLTTAER